MICIASINLNGIRAAKKRTWDEWLERENPDVILMQEVRADSETLAGAMGENWYLASVPSRLKGRAGVAIAVRKDGAANVVGAPRDALDEAETDVDSGRWVEQPVQVGDMTITLVSAYFHSGEKDTPKEVAKMAHLPRIGQRLEELAAKADASHQTVVAGDFNIVRSALDIKNWKPNHNKRAGVLDEEIAFVNAWVDAGWHDITRELAGDVQGPYTWWSWRGKAFDNDSGWRIDYQLATPELAQKATAFRIDRASSWETRFSDHAPLSVDFNI